MGFGGRGRGRGRGGPRGGFMGRGGGGRGGFGGDRGPGQWGGPGGGGPDYGAQHEDFVAVPASKCGLVIGKGGETIKNINQVCYFLAMLINHVFSRTCFVLHAKTLLISCAK